MSNKIPKRRNWSKASVDQHCEASDAKQTTVALTAGKYIKCRAIEPNIANNFGRIHL